MRREERGQSLIETALVVPVLLLLVVGIVDIGAAFNNYITIANAAREGARYGSRFPLDTAGIIDAAIGEPTASALLDVALTADNVTIFCPNPVPGEPIRVTVSYTFPTIIGGTLGLDDIELSSSTDMIIYGPDPLIE